VVNDSEYGELDFKLNNYKIGFHGHNLVDSSRTIKSINIKGQTYQNVFKSGSFYYSVKLGVLNIEYKQNKWSLLKYKML
jgi:hypothetical protein